MAAPKQQVLIIVGPTSSGKSGLAIELAKQFDGEVISADSRQVYRGLTIGTGKVTAREMSGIPHHLLDVASPKNTYSADDFVRDAEQAIQDITKRGKLPIIAGGTGFYIDALVGRIELPNIPPNDALRTRLQKKTAEQLFTELKKKDPARAAMMDTPSERNNKVRLIRAIEIAGGKGWTSAKQRSSLETDFEFLWIGINPTPEELGAKIAARLQKRLKSGMIAEAKNLHTKGLSYKRMIALGLEYRSLALFLQNKLTRKQLEEEIYTTNRRYAHKQITYWKRNKDIRWFKPSDIKQIEKSVQLYVKSPRT